MNWLDDRQVQYRSEIRNKPHSNRMDYWEAFNAWLTEQVDGDTYVIYQPSEEFRGPLSSLRKWGLPAKDSRYKLRWSGKLKPNQTAQDVVDSMIQSRPEGYTGCKPDVGDVVVLSQHGSRTAWYWDTDGFVKISGFEVLKWGDKEKKPSKKDTAETTDFPPDAGDHAE